MDIVAGICLILQSIWDIRTKEIPLWISLGLAVCSFFYSLCCGRTWGSFGLALIPGVLCLISGYCTRQAIGYGDGILLCALAMLYSIEELLKICIIAIMLAGAVGLVILVVLRKNGNSEIPFVPFLVIGWLFFFGEKILKGAFL